MGDNGKVQTERDRSSERERETEKKTEIDRGVNEITACKEEK